MYSIILLISFAIGITSIILISLPETRIEQKLWNKLNIKKIRYWVTKRNTEKSNTNNYDKSLLDRSRKNIVWHITITFVFTFFIFRAHYFNNEIIQYLSFLLFLPILTYFIGTIVQRQKIVILKLRKKSKQ